MTKATKSDWEDAFDTMVFDPAILKNYGKGWENQMGLIKIFIGKVADDQYNAGLEKAMEIAQEKIHYPSMADESIGSWNLALEDIIAATKAEMK